VEPEICPPSSARVIRATSVDVVWVLGVERLFQLLGAVQVELLLRLHKAKKKFIWSKGAKEAMEGSDFTASIEFHSLLKILLISPVRMEVFSEETCGRLRLAKIMNAFMGRFGVPSAFNDCDVSDALGSSVRNKRTSGHCLLGKNLMGSFLLLTIHVRLMFAGIWVLQVALPVVRGGIWIALAKGGVARERVQFHTDRGLQGLLREIFEAAHFSALFNYFNTAIESEDGGDWTGTSIETWVVFCNFGDDGGRRIEGGAVVWADSNGRGDDRAAAAVSESGWQRAPV
jgi:hypothetical protein